MNTQQIIEVLKECNLIYSRFLLDYFYQPDLTDRKWLKEFKQLFEYGVFNNNDALLKEADLGQPIAMWLVGYTASYY
ncbi:MAG: hypothetical protein JWP00_2476 [Chloroflexi bacterium]|jgi:hypothetical protein|nr:hypothetical protein [Chloroflexota bacterium]